MNELVLANRAADWRRLKMLVLDSVSSPITKRVYNLGLDEFFEWFGREPRPGFTKATVSAWRVALETRGLGSISINVRITAVRKLAVEAADNGLLAPELAAGITRIKGVRSKGVRVGNWLSIRQAQTLLNTPDVSTKKGLRDRAMLAILLGCGLRRSEVAALTLKHIQQRDSRWCIVDLVGKHGRVRTIPMPTWVKVAIDSWTLAAGLVSGHVLRRVNRADQAQGERMSEKVVWQLLQPYATAAGVPGIAPHDLRRSFAKMCRAAGGELEQIQLLLGHGNGIHFESKTVTVNIPVHIMGENGAIIESSIFSDHEGTWPINIRAAIHIKGVRGAAVQGLWLRPPAAAARIGSTAVMLENSPRTQVLNNRVTGFQFGVVVQQSDQALVSGNNIAVNPDPALIEADGIIVLNGQFAQVTENTITGATFAGIWANDLNGVAAQNTLTNNFLGIVACHDSAPAYLISGIPASSLQPATRWQAHDNAAHGNSWGMLVTDSAHDNVLINNDSSGNSTYDIELSSATSRFGPLLPASYDNLVVQAFRRSGERTVVKNCGLNNIVIGEVTLVDLKKDSCY